jgi:ubiquinone/menaquinone biosynthesis C-methylase UbiE
MFFIEWLFSTLTFYKESWLSFIWNNSLKLRQKVYETLKKLGVKQVLDLGCGSGRFIRLLANDENFTKIAGVDVSQAPLQIAQKRSTH